MSDPAHGSHAAGSAAQDEPKTPVWLTGLGVALFALAGVYWLASAPAAPTLSELAAASASAVASGPPPTPTPPPRPPAPPPPPPPSPPPAPHAVVPAGAHLPGSAGFAVHGAGAKPKAGNAAKRTATGR